MTDRQSPPNPYQPPGTDPLPDASAPLPPSHIVVPLLALFATLYFVQGIAEPTAGLPAQPMQNRLEDWGRTPSQVGYFLFFIGLPWSFKLLFGLISDFLPIRGYRRLPYLVLSTAATGAAFVWMSGLWSDPANERQLAWLLFGACVAIAMSDVVIDGLAVETGQPVGLTGQIQSVQWGALSVAQILGGFLAGYVSQNGLLRSAFIGCGLLSFMSLAVVLVVVREPRHASQPSDNLRQAWEQLKSGRKLAILVSVGLYLFLWNFNPFSSNVLQHYSTEVLGLSEQFYGNLSSIQGFTQVLACFAYFFVCRRIPFNWLVHASIACGVLATLCYWPMHDALSAVVASLVFGLTYQTATLIQLDLAARVCPTQSAATIFALLMAISNTGLTASIGVGGRWYDALTDQFGSRHVAFDALVAIGALFTAGCWLLVPVMRWAGVQDYR